MIFMKILALVYIINATLLLLHEIESAYVKEWEILKIPGHITGFLLLHIPIIMILFWGAIEIAKQTSFGTIVALIAGVGGLIPYIIHKVIAKKQGYFELKISNSIIYLNAWTGIITTILAVGLFFS